MPVIAVTMSVLRAGEDGLYGDGGTWGSADRGCVAPVPVADAE